MKEPKIRFKGFRGEWKISELGDFSTSFSGGTPTAGVSDYYGGDIPFIRSGEIHEDRTELFITQSGLNSSSAKIVDKGTLLYALYGATSGEVAISKLEGAINQAILAIFPNKSVDKRFLAHFLKSHKERIVSELLQGGQGNLSGTLVKGIPVSYPELSEQNAIANYIDSIDAQISASTSRLASLKQMKAASLQAMFPQEGETVPKVRFKGFEGEWNKAVVGKIGYTYSGLSGKSKDDFGTGNAQFITFMNVLNNAQIDTSILDFVEVRISEHQNEVRKGDLFFNTSSETPEEVGMCAVLKEDVNNVYLNSFCFGFRLTDDSVYPSYIAYLMRSNIGRHIMSILAQGATRYNLSKNNFCQTEIPMPCKKEQQSIASFFTSLDRQIALHAKRLEKLKQIKATCLDKMFV